MNNVIMMECSSKPSRIKKLKGFTLVEIIVVLVILAVLAVAMIPALTGYIDKANEKTALMETRSVMLALQTLSTEKYAKDGKGNYKLSDFSEEEVFKLADIPGEVAELKDVTTDEKGKITFLRYTTTDGYNTTYTSAGYAISLDSEEEELVLPGVSLPNKK